MKDYWSIYIGVNSTSNIGITESNRICVDNNKRGSENVQIDLGEATMGNFDTLISYLERLKIHGTK